MSTLVFVRHAQASLFADDYDHLSRLGEQQSGELGRYFKRYGVGFDEICIGPRKRHRHTAALAGQVCGGFAEFTEFREFDEHHVDQLVSGHLDELCEQIPHLREQRNRFHGSETSTQRQRTFAKLFESVAILWISGRCPLFGLESWDEFRTRVCAGIDQIVKRGGSGRRVLVATSAGTIVAALQHALQCPDETALGLGWRIWNCSMTSFAFTEDRFTLDSFNSMTHLEDHALWTYR
ncbi:MAG: phosphoglycerate mutase family protein [Fuerstiella sp.]|nr:phosphoglycerate mutase family protein [Fuerstiella sp.]